MIADLIFMITSMSLPEGDMVGVLVKAYGSIRFCSRNDFSRMLLSFQWFVNMGKPGSAFLQY
ncbi:MAG: hypothetical protein CVV51_06925 [Spirochaetae bacterium HGW-Spirochaetae-7]|nr:MAG: hypothetical protein CVV51_06925 [Spirochaetae bacterium HGW-Spirochaetae-7]